jgi:two-component system phosphate regulon sensor histidine kinase PhoR
MWSSRLFLKLFLTYAGLILLTTGVCSAIIAGWQEEQLIEQVQRRLRDSAVLLRDSVVDPEDFGQPFVGDSVQLQLQIRQLGQRTATRFTLVDALGKVLADSEQSTLADVEAMDNHLTRQEFVKAQRDGSGYSRRRSTTLQAPFLYYALAIIKADKSSGFVRAAEPIDSILAEVSGLRRLIGWAGLGVGLSGLIVTYWLTRRIVQPIQDLTVAAEEMAAGRPPRRVGITTRDEIGTLASTFEHMVAKLRRRESALGESADRQSAVLSGMNEGVVAVDSIQHVLFANRAAGNMLGFSPDQSTQQPLLEVVRSHELHTLVQRSLASEQPTQSEISFHADTVRTLDVNATPLPGDPCPGVVLVLHDISELKRLEGLRQQFVANVSHELKTPLSSIKAYTETLLNGALEDRDNARRFLHRIDDQSDKLHDLIIDMLSLAKIESGQTTIEFVTLPLKRVAATCVADWEARARAEEITIQNDIAHSDIQVQADEESLLQILNNLIDNALKYTPAGGTVALSCRKEGNQAAIEVRDTGIGIDPIHHDRLFERFYRVDKARSRELGGTGLGLAIVKHLCTQLEGSVALESTPGEGSTFCVRISLANQSR